MGRVSAPSLEKPRARRRRPSVLGVIGLVLLLGGLGCLGWIAYQYVGTNVVSKRAFEQESGELRARWDAQPPAPAVPTGSADPALSDAQPRAVPGDAIALLRIPRFGDSYEVPILEGTELSVLARGVGHYPSTAQPGQIGNFAIAGHRVTHGQPFSRLLELDKGDQILVETRSAIYTYVIDTAPRDLTVEENATWVVDPVPGQPDATPTQALITLTTCQDLFHSPDRSIGFGHLQSTKNKG
ncbi:class E sortase [Microlunatus ginsengisoli]|uniref:Class E sortase n=1 Tax=Microlunatus ginsengisoli TaxID=363863 RepID=A0ABP7A5E9_9ACTN